jgi:very-short-patch-repair endonuclease
MADCTFESKTVTRTSAPKAPREGSKGEEAFALHCRVDGLTPEREFMFHPKRRWRFDFCFPDRMVAIEIEGGVGGRHQRIGGFTGDCVKYAEAAILGWRVIRATTAQVMSGQAIEWTHRALK